MAATVISAAAAINAAAIGTPTIAKAVTAGSRLCSSRPATSRHGIPSATWTSASARGASVAKLVPGICSDLQASRPPRNENIPAGWRRAAAPVVYAAIQGSRNRLSFTRRRSRWPSASSGVISPPGGAVAASMSAATPPTPETTASFADASA